MRYIINIEDEPLKKYAGTKSEVKLYKATGFNSLVFDETGLKKLEPYEDNSYEQYQNGARDAWDAYNKAIQLEKTVFDRYFPQGSINDRQQLFEMDPIEAINLIKKIEKSKDRKYMWFCPECGLEVSSDYKTCPRCGFMRGDVK